MLSFVKSCQTSLTIPELPGEVRNPLELLLLLSRSRGFLVINFTTVEGDMETPCVTDTSFLYKDKAVFTVREHFYL